MVGGDPVAARAYIAFAACLALTTCVARLDPLPTELSSERVAAALQAGAIRDARAEFAASLCADGASPDCRELLRGPVVEPEPVPRAAATIARPRLVFVAGLFAECLAHWVRPFEDVRPQFDARGYETSEVAVAGRGTAAENGDRVARALSALPRDGRPAVVVAYSKGVVDVLEALVRHPEIRDVPSAMIAIAGAHNGSHLAAQRGDFYEAVITALPMRGCERGTGEEVRELAPDRRLAWWQAHAAVVRLPVFALVGLPRPGTVAPFLAAGHAAISRVDPFNDGNIVWQDALVQGGTLLGFVDADHWSIVTPIERIVQPADPGASRLVPRARFLESALNVVMRSLEPPRRAGVGPR